MFNRRSMIACLCLWITFAVAGAQAQSIAVSVKADLQAVMQTHIDEHLVNGAYLHLDQNTGDVAKLYPVAAHPMILQIGGYYVLCSDFRDTEGNSYSVDFYVALRNGQYLVFKTSVEDRALIDKFRKANG